MKGEELSQSSENAIPRLRTSGVKLSERGGKAKQLPARSTVNKNVSADNYC